jgi:hypothetical protein
LLGDNTKLVLSSEWMFSPFTLTQVFPELPEFVFIGIPASESGNALIVPSTGHELGHPVWRTKQLHVLFEQKLRDIIVTYYTTHWDEFKMCFGDHPDPTRLTSDIILLPTWVPAVKIATRQCEECFCDFLGIRLFGESFLHSFEYLVAPNMGQARHTSYPPLAKRAKYMIECLSTMGESARADFSARFSEVPLQHPRRADKFMLEACDSAVEELVPELIRTAIKFADNANIPRCKADGVSIACDQFRQVEPAFEASIHLGDIINAAWSAYLDPSFWPERLIPHDRKFEVISELALKSIEVLEFQTRTSENVT